ncbi:MAG: TonB family protein, partial [Spirosoma sp.]|nr:TonB family protein [Spirosoma sp.]
MKYLLFVYLFIGCLSAFSQDTVYQDFEADSAAQPQGGMAYLLGTFLETNLRKPIPFESKGVSGRSVVSAIVEPNGQVSNVKAIPGKFPELDREAVRAFRLFNAWKPARKGGKSVRQQVNIPILFKPNEPFLYVDGAHISYFDANQKPVAEGSDQARYKQVAPVDTNGLPTGDIIVYKGKGSNWKEDYRNPLVKNEIKQRGLERKTIYQIGYENGHKQWQGMVYSLDDTGAIVSRIYHENGRSKGPSLTYYPNGLVATRTSEVDGKQAITSWYMNGQIKQIRVIDPADPVLAHTRPQIMALWDSTGTQLVRGGNGQAIYRGIRKSYGDTTRQTAFVEQGLYADGFKQGTWTGRYADGSYFYEERYEKGTSTGGKALKAGSDTIRYVVAEQQFEFPGGMSGLGQFLSSNLTYPVSAQKAGVQGKVFISFTVNTDGTLSDYEVIKG